MVSKELNSKMGILYKELWGLYNSGELENINDEEGIILRSFLINMCENIGEDLSGLVNLNIFEDGEDVKNVYKKYIE